MRQNPVAFVVGHRFPLAFLMSGNDGAYFDANALMLANWFYRPSAHEVAQYSQPCDLALLRVSPHLLFLAYRFGDMPWSDIPHSASIEPQHHRHYAWAHDSARRHLLVSTVLVESESKTILSLRTFTVNEQFSETLAACVREQAGYVRTQEQHLAEVQAAYRVFPHSADIAAAANTRSRSGR